MVRLLFTSNFSRPSSPNRFSFLSTVLPPSSSSLLPLLNLLPLLPLLPFSPRPLPFLPPAFGLTSFTSQTGGASASPLPKDYKFKWYTAQI